MLRAPDAWNAPRHTARTRHRLSWWNRLRWGFGMVPFRRCPGQHRARNIFGDEILAAGGMRSHCLDCQKRWPSLIGRDSEVALWEKGWVENFVDDFRAKNPVQDPSV